MRPAADAVAEVLGRSGAAGAIREHRLVTMWTEIVGERVAARAWPDGLRDGVLWVRAANSAWMHELSFLREPITERANALVGPPPLVREVRFHLGRPRDEDDRDDVVAALSRRLRPSRKSTPARPAPSPEALARIDAETARVEDPELRDAIRTLRRKLGL